MKLRLRLGAKSLDLVAPDKPAVRVRVMRTGDISADHSLADRILQSEAIIAAAELLILYGSTDKDGVFTYCAPPRDGRDAIAILRKVVGPCS